MEKLREKITDDQMTNDANKVATGVGLPQYPLTLPVSKAIKVATEVEKSITVTTKHAVAGAIPAQVENAKGALHAIYSKIDAQFGKLSSMRSRKSLLRPFIPDGPRELSITLNNDPFNPDAWVGRSEVEKPYRAALAELDKLNELYVKYEKNFVLKRSQQPAPPVCCMQDRRYPNA